MKSSLAIDVKDLAVSKNVIYEEIKRGRIPAIRIGRRFKIPADTADRLLAEAKEKAAATRAGNAPAPTEEEPR